MKRVAMLFLVSIMILFTTLAFADANRLINFDSESYVVYVGKQQKVTATVECVDDTAPKKTTLVWSSSDTSIAKVSTSGSITGVSAGTVTIQAQAKDDESIVHTATVEIRSTVQKVTVAPQSTTLLVGAKDEDAKLQLEYTITPDEAFHQGVTWTTSNPSVATVDEAGLVTAVARGTAVITATSTDPTSVKKATCKVTVAQAATGIALDKDELNIPAGKSASLKATISPSDASNKQVTWSTSDESIATVSSSGQVRGVSAGAAVITATAKDGSGVVATCTVSVVTPVKKITSEVKSISMAPSTTWHLTATVEPEEATLKDILWSSSNEKVATVDENGVVTGVAKGSATITGTAIDGSNVKAKIQVKVQEYDLVFTDKTPQTVYYYYGSGIFTITDSVKEGNVSIPSINTFMMASVVGGKAKEPVEVTPVKPGTDTVTIKVGSKKYKYTVYVSPEAFAD